MGKSSKINVVYALTRNYYYKLKPSLTSLREHNPDVRVFILAEDDEIAGVNDAEVINVSVQEYFPVEGINYYNAFTYINLLKVCYPELLKVSKVIHLDVDTIICGSLEELWNTKLTGKWVGACPEYLGTYKPFGDLYYNMGVAVINLMQMRKDKIVPKMVEYLNTVPQPYADQDAWNIYGLEQDKFVTVDVRFNECFCCGKTDDPVIVHYCGAHNWYENPVTERYEYLRKYL